MTSFDEVETRQETAPGSHSCPRSSTSSLVSSPAALVQPTSVVASNACACPNEALIATGIVGGSSAGNGRNCRFLSQTVPFPPVLLAIANSILSTCVSGVPPDGPHANWI